MAVGLWEYNASVTSQKHTGPIAVVGATTWGITLAIILARRGIHVQVLARTQEEAEVLELEREHVARLPGYAFPASMHVTATAFEAFDGATALIYAVPATHMRSNLQATASVISGTPLIISGAKGLERGSSKRMSEVMTEELPPVLHSRVCALSGPNLAKEIVKNKPATSVVASADARSAEEAQAALNVGTFRVYTNTDIVGVEFGGALKNIIAIGAGISDGLDYGNNAKASFLTRGLAEIARLGVAAGANPLTFAGLAGLGDLMTTCYSPLSRNYRLGTEIARGKALEDVLAEMGEVVEGVNTTPAALEIAQALGVEMPITEITNRILFEELSIKEAVFQLLAREPKPEWAGIKD
jgi:glycerol-3-phosphate dehydrogenase (NAD(P)+)